MMEILSQLPTLEMIIEYITIGFFLGALAGAVLGASTLPIMEKGAVGLMPLLITAGLGILIGIYFESDTFQALSRRDLSGSDAFRAEAFNAVVQVIGWSMTTMVIGAVIANYRLAFWGFIVGGLMGTLSGIFIQIIGEEFGFPLDSPITTIVVAIIAVSLVVLVGAGREKEIRR